MDKDTKKALLFRLGCIQKYAEVGSIRSMKNEVETLISEIEELNVVVPF